MKSQRYGLYVSFCVCAGAAIAGDTVTTDFSNGAEGWTGPFGPGGATQILSEGGNDGAYMNTVFNNFGITFKNSTNNAFLGDYTTAGEITLSMDIRVDYLNFFGQDVSRPWLVELRDFDGATNGYPYNSVWFLFDNISQAENSEWSTYSVTFDPNAIDIPSGWAGYGAEDPNTFEPTLPDGVSFADVLSGVDEIAFTTFQPGFFFGFADHTIGIDNLSITRTVPTPSALALLGLSGMVGTRRRR
ncbi:MAG: hypothetical protein RLN78_12400 [Phycisphaerales bacterium]